MGYTVAILGQMEFGRDTVRFVDLGAVEEPVQIWVVVLCSGTVEMNCDSVT